MAIVLQIRSNGQITLPSSIRKQARLKEGDLLEVTVDEDGTLHLLPKLAVDRTQAYFWTNRWQKGEKEVEDDLLAGRYQDFDDMEEFIQSLKDEIE
jgi:AbrB family looped-hinge helix DNA binding protein